MKVGDLVGVNETRGSGVFKHVIALGVGIILDIEETDDLTFGRVGPVNLGELITVMLNSGETKVFSSKSLEVL